MPAATAQKSASARAPASGAVSPDARIVSLRDIDKTFANGTVALRGYNLDVGANEFISLLGPSGCGKSTVLRLIAGLGEPSRGSIKWSSGSSNKSDIGFVFQEATLMPWATVFDNVFLPFLLTGVGKDRGTPKVMEMLELVGLKGFESAYPRELSGGMKMRVSIARALVTKPRLLLMDEPFAALDEITRDKLANDLLTIWRHAECTIIFVTHSVFESVYLSQRIAVMAARPGRTIGELTIDHPYPRTSEFRLTGEYTDYCRQVSLLLNEAMGVGGH